jgi:hypothetical protein
LVGTWKYDNKVKETRIQLVLSFGNDGAYELGLRHTNQSGQFTPWATERGTFQVGSAEIVFVASGGNSKDVPMARKYVRDGGYLWITFPEIGYQLPFSRPSPEATSASKSTPPVTESAPASVPQQGYIPQQVYAPGSSRQRPGLPGRFLPGRR